MFPEEILNKNFLFFYEYIQENQTPKNDWYALIDHWRDEREKMELQSVKSNNLIDKLIFYYIDGGHFIKIYDKRNYRDVNIYILNEVEREIFLTCTNIITLWELRNKLTTLSEFEINTILKNFEENKIIYRENDF
jgi:hypothetical protein